MGPDKPFKGPHKGFWGSKKTMNKPLKSPFDVVLSGGPLPTFFSGPQATVYGPAYCLFEYELLCPRQLISHIDSYRLRTHRWPQGLDLVFAVFFSFKVV